MKIRILFFTALFCAAAFSHADIKKGDKLQTLANLHPDIAKRVLYTTNYQLQGGLIPVCSDVTILSINKKELAFEWKGTAFSMRWDKAQKQAGISLADVAGDFFGAKCDSAKIASLNAADKAGIKSGIPSVGMTKQGIIFAMGPPPKHANIDLEAQTWMYWLNKFKRKAIDFDEKGVVTDVRL